MTIENIVTASVAQFVKQARPTKFFTGLFQDRGATNQEKIQIDITRGEERVAIDVLAGTGPNGQKKLIPYTSKEYVTPAYDESYLLTAGQTKFRLAGQNAFVERDVNRAMSDFFTEAMIDAQARIDRAVERQAIEVLTLGTLTFENNESIDFKMKASHKLTAVATWDNATADAALDLEKACDEVRKDGLMAPDMCIMGDASFREFLNLTQTKDRINFRRADLIDIPSPRPLAAEQGATFQGSLSTGPYKLDIFTYPQWYVTSADGVLPVTKARYMPSEKVIVMNSQARLDLWYGAIVRFSDGNVEGASAVNFGSVMTSKEAQRSAPYVWMGDRGLALEAGVRSRPLCVPVDIDSFSVLDT